MTDATRTPADGDNPFQLLPGLSSDEYETLKADIAANGQRDPIVLRSGTGEIVDGHHRLRVCQELGLTPKTSEVWFDTDLEASAYALRVNTARRQLSSFQLSEVRSRQKAIYFELRSSHGMNQQEAAVQVGVPYGTCARWEAEAKKPADNAPLSGTNLHPKNGTQQPVVEAVDALPALELPDKRVRLTPDQKKHVYDLVANHGRTHQEVADDYKVSREAITKTVRQERDRREQSAKHEQIKQAAAIAVMGDYRTLVIDPPWPVKKIERDERPDQSEHLDYPTLDIWCQRPDYPLMDKNDPDPCTGHDPELYLDEPPSPCASIECVVNSVLAQIGYDDSHLYLWTTHKFLPDALKLADAWGYRYQCLMTWRKNVGMTPFSWMYDTEHVLFCRRGSLNLERNGLRLSFDAPVTRHSAKPDVFYDRVIEASPAPRLELFSRTPREGFDAWGNEASDAV